MKIEELATGQNVRLCARIGEEQLEFETVVQDVIPRKHTILTDVIKRNDKIITFHAKGLIVDLHVQPPDSAPLIFKNTTVALQKKQDDSYCYAISTITEAKALNRRQSFRVYIGQATSIQCGSNHAAYDAIIRDVSATGFSVAVNGEQEFYENQVIHALLNDYLEETAENFSFHLYGIIVRIIEEENGLKIYGCRLNVKVPGLEPYLMKKERLRLKRTNGGNL